jgi:DSF synthase
MASDVRSVFNFGGDLSLFVLLVRARDLDSLKLYARRCVDLVWWLENAAQIGVYTTALVQGDTLGGGLESALLHHNVIFERGAQAGFPEVLFNLFPGMGAWHLAIRKAGMVVATDMILSGQIYTAEQLQRRGLVDLVVEDGEGEMALEKLVRSVSPDCAAPWPLCKHGVWRTDYLRVASDSSRLWAATALTLTDRDLRLMERLARAQVRKVGGGAEGAVEEIKRMELDTAWDFEKTGVSEWSSF